MKKLPYPILLLLALFTGLCTSCLDETLLSTTYGTGSGDSDREIRLKIATTRALGIDGPSAMTKEERVVTLDLLVFAKDKAGTENYYLQQVVSGKPTEGLSNTFDVVMPIGENFDIHFFANVHDDLVDRKVLSGRGGLREKLLETATQRLVFNDYSSDTDLQADATNLPMYGRLPDVNISKDEPVSSSLEVDVLRSVATVCVTTLATIDEDEKTIIPGKITNFEMRELYVYYPAGEGLIAPLPENIDKKDKDGNVNSPTLPPSVSTIPGGIWWKGDDENILSPFFRPEKISTKEVGLIDKLYFYENIAGDLSGFQTRLVIGGVFGNDKMPDGSTPKVTYYRINFWDAGETFFPVLRNHRYIFNIQKVDDSGAETPDQAAKGKPINIKVKVIDWVDDLYDIDYDGQHYFKTQTKDIVLPRTAGATRTIDVASDVEVGEWEMSFADGHNGTITPTKEITLKNDRFEITKSADGKKLTFKVLTAFSDVLVLPATRNDVFVIQAKNLRVLYNLRQVDKASDDWGNGGDLDTGVGEDPNKAI